MQKLKERKKRCPGPSLASNRTLNQRSPGGQLRSQLQTLQGRRRRRLPNSLQILMHRKVMQKVFGWVGACFFSVCVSRSFWCCNENIVHPITHTPNQRASVSEDRQGPHLGPVHNYWYIITRKHAIQVPSVYMIGQRQNTRFAYACFVNLQGGMGT